MKKYVLTAILTKEGGWYVAENPETGVASQGKTVDGALDNLKEAVELYLEEFPLKQASRSFMTVFEVIQNAKTAETVGA